jgi:hypothetical protein
MRPLTMAPKRRTTVHADTNHQDHDGSASEASSWRVVYDQARSKDEAMVREYKEEVDTLLIFVRRPRTLSTSNVY